MYILITYQFHDDIGHMRDAVRPAHIAHLQSAGALVAGPAMSPSGEATGSVIVLPNMDYAKAEAFVTNDPYVTAGIIKTHAITFFNGALGEWIKERS